MSSASVKIRKMSKFELGWVAGLLEGEGCFTARAPKKSSTKLYLSVDVQSGDRDVIERLIQYTGLGKLGGPYKTRARHHTPMYGWKLSSQPAEILMETILPHMCGRRADRIRESLALAKQVR